MRTMQTVDDTTKTWGNDYMGIAVPYVKLELGRFKLAIDTNSPLTPTRLMPELALHIFHGICQYQ